MMARLTEDPCVHSDCELADVTFGRFCEVGRGSRIQNSHLNDYSYCDRYADIANAQVGKFANIAAFVRIGATDHPMDTASMHHFLYRAADYWDDAENDAVFFAHRGSRTTWIGHDTWIGHAAMIKPEVTIGHGAIVASGAIVTRDVAPYTIVAGTPAAKLRDRHDPAVVADLLALAWWDWPHDRLRTALDDFRSLSAAAFVKRYG
ncbi:MAG: phosphonate metabolism protein (transferase hexapeptide repeat family) [Loktanella salsilacus]|jgi:phosphonate metabolism protein (transferase hexapeptide repeat family)